MNRVCVFCGSSPGLGDDYLALARSLGETLAQRGIELVYGGAAVGLMGATADACLGAGGRVIGVIPEYLADKELAHPGLTQLEVVDSMHARKARMADLSDAFVALPGGVGTLEELFEIWTWTQLGLHRKPLGVVNAGGFYQGLIDFVAHLAEQGFMKPAHRDLLLADPTPAGLLDRLAAADLPDLPKWVEPPRR